MFCLLLMPVCYMIMTNPKNLLVDLEPLIFKGNKFTKTDRFNSFVPPLQAHRNW